MTRQQNIEIIKSYYEEIFHAQSNSIAAMDKFVADSFIQHSNHISEGKDGLIASLNELLVQKPHMEIIKVFANDQDEVAVFLKQTLTATGTVNKIADIFRLKDGKIAEHWDVVDPDVAGIELKSGRELFSTDASTFATPDPEVQADFIKKVVDFNIEIFNAHNNDKAVLDAYMRDDYMQHNPSAEDGKEGFIGFTNFFFTLDPKMDISKTFANEDGEVAVFFKCTCQANGMVNKVCDIYRLNDGKLSEHWDIVEHGVEEFLPNGISIF